MNQNYEFLVEAAFEIQKRAYAPYSHFHIGAALLTKDHKIIPGVNVENAAYGVTMCGERNAMFSAYAQGYRKEDIEAIAIVSNSKPVASPCGSCRQVMVELLNPDTPVILASSLGEVIETTPRELLPFAFSKENL